MHDYSENNEPSTFEKQVLAIEREREKERKREREREREREGKREGESDKNIKNITIALTHCATCYSIYNNRFHLPAI